MCWGRLHCLANVVLLGWACALLVAIPLAARLPGAAHGAPYKAPPNSPSAVAKAVLEQKFPALSHGGSPISPVLVLLLHSHVDVLDGPGAAGIADFSDTVRAAIAAEDPWRLFELEVAGYFLGLASLRLPARGGRVRRIFVSQHRRTTTIFISATNRTRDTTAAEKAAFVSFLRGLCSSAAPPGVEVALTGPVVLEVERRTKAAGLNGSLVLLELVILPWALCVFLCLLQKEQRWALPLPLLMLLVATAVSSALVLPLARAAPVSPEILHILLAGVCALSLDYSLLVLTRFSESCGGPTPLEQRVWTLLLSTGRTVVVSGSLVIIAFLGGSLLPEANLSSGCMVLAIAAATCVAVNVTLLPAVLLICSSCLQARRQRLDRPMQIGSGERKHAGCRVSGTAHAQLGSRQLVQLSAGTSLSLDSDALHIKAWLRLMNVVERHPKVVALAILAPCLPLMRAAASLRVTADIFTLLPWDLPSVQALKLLEQDFPAGLTEPFTLMITAPPGHLLDKQGYSAVNQLYKALNSTEQVAFIVSPYHFLGTPITWELLHWNGTKRSSERCFFTTLCTAWTGFRQAVSDKWMKDSAKSYDALVQSATNGSAAVSWLYTTFFPRGALAGPWIQDARWQIARWEQQNPGYSALLSGGLAELVDTRTVVMDAVQRHVGGSILAILFVVLLTFRSLLLTCRLALALLVSTGTTYGVASLVYGSPALGAVVPSLRGFDHGLFFAVVPQSLAVVVALGLDYDIFLVSRIAEYRAAGLTDAESIRMGVAQTGGAISGAATIMALSFASLFTMHQVLLHQYAVVLVTSVLLDAFLVRTLLVPALMFTASSWNWWPRKMPEPHGELCHAGSLAAFSSCDVEVVACTDSAEGQASQVIGAPAMAAEV